MAGVKTHWSVQRDLGMGGPKASSSVVSEARIRFCRLERHLGMYSKEKRDSWDMLDF